MSRPRIGAYVLAADPTWLRSSLASYYDQLDVLVVSAPSDGRGWTGHPVRSAECVQIIESCDRRGIARVERGVWRNAERPLQAETDQRQAALDAVGTDVDWVLQIDSDELLPDPQALLAALDFADSEGLDAVEWPMQVLFRRLRGGRYLQVVAADGRDRYEYPGPIAVRAGTRLHECRRAEVRYLRPVVEGDDRSTQLLASCEPDEVRSWTLPSSAAIVHNTWARSTSDVRRKISSWGHARDLRPTFYFWLIWRPATWRWRWMRDFHPLVGPLWPRLQPSAAEFVHLLDPADR